MPTNFDKMVRKRFLVAIIREILLLCELSGQIFAIPNVHSPRQPNGRQLYSNYHGSKAARNYLYLNYKETYGIRFDPNKIRRRFMNHSSDGGTNWDNNPSIDNGDPSVDNNDSGWNSGDPNMDNNDPSVDNGDPSIDNGDPNVDNSDPSLDNGEPSIDPSMDNNDPNIDNIDPNMDNGDSGNN